MMTKRIVVFGRTGSGKSSLGNKIFGVDTFQEGHTLLSETSESMEKVLSWPLSPSFEVSFLDTPGFADNRPNISNKVIIGNILKLLKNVKEGFNIGIFCISARDRIDSHDIEEIKLVQSMLGKGVFQHLWIAITQLNLFEETAKERFLGKISKELPELLKANEIPLLPDRILFADFDNFETKFLKILDPLLRDTLCYLPENSLKLQQMEENGFDFLHSHEMKAILGIYTEIYDRQIQQLEKAIEKISKHGSNNSMLTQRLEAKQEVGKKYEELKSIINKTAPLECQESRITSEFDKNQSKEDNHWCWKLDHNARLLDDNISIEHIGPSQYFVQTLENWLESGNFIWIVKINHQSNNFWTNIKYHLNSGHVSFGIKNQQDEVFSISKSGHALSNMINTDSFPAAKIKNTIEFICELKLNQRQFTISVGDLVIARTQNPLRVSDKYIPFVNLWKGNIATIKFI